MEPWQIIVALIQGLVEWLPISSEGQAVLFVYNISTVPPDQLITLVVWLHLGTTLAVIARYPRTILDLLTLADRPLLKLLILATIGTAITAVPLYFILKATILAFNGEILNILVGGLLLVTALVLYLPTRDSSEEIEVKEQPSEKEAFLSGLVQGFSVLPGLSRSGVTVSALLMQKVDKETALKFSFFMSIPAVLGIFFLDVVVGQAPLPVSTVDLFFVELIVFITGLLSMEFLLQVAKRVSFWKLCVVLAIIAIVFGLPTLF